MAAPRTLRELAGVLPTDQHAELIGVDTSLGADPTSAPLIVDITHDSRQVRDGWAFACVVGAREDGHQFAGSAVEVGAAALVVERPMPFDVAQLVVADVRRAVGPIAAEIHGHPSAAMRTVGVTGTNGKTTTTHMLAAIMRAAGMETRVQGTLSGARTTPEAADLQRLLAGYVADGVDAIAMEVSSHALALHRVAGMQFEVGVFTNLGRDHLDLHESMEAYFRAKAGLFTPELCRIGVANRDDLHGRLLADAAPIQMVTYGLDDVSDVRVTVARTEFSWRSRHVVVPLGGHFNVSNTVAALTTAEVLGIDHDVAIAGLAELPPVAGRFERVSDPRGELAVVVDYAHTPDGLIEVLRAARAVASGARLILVFGCGGDRDVDKRPLMGSVAAEHADVVVVTSDNPRHEDPMAIIDAAVEGIEPRYREAVRIEPDRRRAIALAIREAIPGDVVIVAGKGHETTQTIGDTAYPFDDRVVVGEVLAARAGELAP